MPIIHIINMYKQYKPPSLLKGVHSSTLHIQRTPLLEHENELVPQGEPAICNIQGKVTSTEVHQKS